MANIKKNFNFRNGVQVDDDNLLVTSTGLVGIGTTIPTEALDVRGNVIITGFTSATSQNVGFLTVATLEPTKIIGAGISIVSGIVTATGTGIITFFGDARNLQGMPTSQWEDKDVGLGFTSIYNTGGNVGIATEDPRTTFQVGGNIDAGEKGIGISSVGNINAAGIITATTFVGNVTGNVTGRITGDLVGDINSSGISTFVALDVNGDSDFDGHTNIDNLSVAGVSTFTGLIDGNGGANIDNVQIGVSNDNEIDTASGNLTIDSAGGQVIVDDHLSVTGVSTFADVIEAPAGMNKVPSLYMNQSNLPSASDYHGMFAHVHGTGRGYFAHAMNWYELVNKDLFGVVGTGTERYNIGVTTISSLIVSGATNFTGAVNATTIEVPNATVTTKLGVGTTDTPAGDLQVTKSSLAEVQICSTGSIAQLNVGKGGGTSKTHTSQIRFGGGAGAPYSASGTSLDIINYDTGNFNYHLSGNNAAAVVGDFHWHKGINSSRLMTLTGIGGSLGIGNTQPTKTLDVTGAGNFSGDVTVGNNLTVGGALLGNVQGTLTGNVSGTLQGNSNTTVGISTLNNLTIAGIVTASQANITSIGIGTNPEINRPFRVNDLPAERIFITSGGTIGIQTSLVFDGIGINASTTTLSVGAIGVGVTILHKAVDFSNAGLSTNRMMVPPKVSSTAGLQNPVQGALVFNTTANKLQFYNGTSWTNV